MRNYSKYTRHLTPGAEHEAHVVVAQEFDADAATVHLTVHSWATEAGLDADHLHATTMHLDFRAENYDAEDWADPWTHVVNHPTWTAGAEPPKKSVWDESTSAWHSLQSLEEIKADKWAEVKSMRDRLEFGGFAWDGSGFDSDQLSQARISSTALAATLNPQATFDWTLQDNTTRTLTAAEFVQMATAMLVHVETLHATSRVLRQQIESFTEDTPAHRDAVAAIAWPS